MIHISRGVHKLKQWKMLTYIILNIKYYYFPIVSTYNDNTAQLLSLLIDNYIIFKLDPIVIPL